MQAGPDSDQPAERVHRASIPSTAHGFEEIVRLLAGNVTSVHQTHQNSDAGKTTWTSRGAPAWARLLQTVVSTTTGW